MKLPSNIIQWLYNLSDREKELLRQLIKQDSSSFPRLLLKISRLTLAADTGNILLWKKLMADEEKDIFELNHSLQDQTEITRIRKNIELTS